MTLKINLSEILSKAWKITWKFKVLWIFGILAGCGSGNSSRFNSNSSGGGGGNGGSGGTGQVPDFLRPFLNSRPEVAIRSFFQQYLAIIIGVMIAVCLLWFLFYFLGVMGKIGLIKGASKADAGAESMTFGELWTESTPYFWRVFGMNLLVGLPFFLVMVILLGGMAFAAFGITRSGTSNGGTAALMIGLIGILVMVICIISIIALLVQMVVQQAQNALVLENLGVLESLTRGWNVFKANFFSVIIMLLVLGILGWVVGFIVALPMVLIALPALVGGAMAGTATQGYLIPLLIAGGCCALYLPVLLLLSGVLQTYTQTAWTLTFLRMTAPEIPSAPAPLVVSEG